MNPFAQAVPCERCEDTDYGYAHRQIADTAPSEIETLLLEKLERWEMLEGKQNGG